MSLEKVWIKNFRNISEVLVDFKEINQNLYIYGPNNQGKTNFLLALHTLGKMKLPVGIKVEDLVREDQNSAFVAIQKRVPYLDNLLKLYLKVENSKINIFVDEKSNIKKSELNHIFPVFYLSADTLFSFSSSPSSRRELLDQFIASIDSEYQECLKKFQKLVKQKNKLLKANLPILNVYNESLAEYSEKIVSKRLSFLKQLEKSLTTSLLFLFENKEISLSLHYNAKYLNSNLESINQYKENLLECLPDLENKEYILKYSLVGAHQDDWQILIDEKNLLKRYSRGIQRSVVTLLYDAFQKSVKRETPFLLLIDDAFVEVDDSNKAKLIKILESSFQIVYVSTQREDESCFENISVFKIDKGRLCKS